jgi:hypothetical protein
MGRKSLGPRKANTVRVPIDHAEIYEAEARRRGMDYGQYVAWCMARIHGLKLPTDWIDAQEELPLTA